MKVKNFAKTLGILFGVLVGLFILKSPVLASGGYGPYGPYGPIIEETGLVDTAILYFLGALLYLVGILFLLNIGLLKKRISSLQK